MRIRHHTRDDKIELQMTPMIDIVFQLNIFFLFTFQIVLPEGDFYIHMPAAAAQRAVQQTETLPVSVVLRAGPLGELSQLQADGRNFGSGEEAFRRLRSYIMGLVNDAGGPGRSADQEVELDFDYDLRYEHVIDAITAITGYIDQDNQRHKLIERIKFTPPKR
jgi:biopolymer transport protein ExbD